MDQQVTHTVPGLRGATRPSRSPSRRVFAFIALLATLTCLVAVVLTSRANNEQVVRLQTRGIATTITVTSCLGNLGGSGSNAAGYTCHGTYEVAGHSRNALIHGLSDYVEPGSRRPGIVDPAQPNFVMLATAVPLLHQRQPWFALALLAVLAALFLGALLRQRTSSLHA